MIDRVKHRIRFKFYQHSKNYPGREIRLQDPVGSDGVSDAIRQLPTGIRQLPIGSRRKLSESFLLDSDRKLSDVGSDDFRRFPTVGKCRDPAGSCRIPSESVGKRRIQSDIVGWPQEINPIPLDPSIPHPSLVPSSWPQPLHIPLYLPIISTYLSSIQLTNIYLTSYLPIYISIKLTNYFLSITYLYI